VVLNDLCFVSATEGWIAGEFGTILHTEDGGQTWTSQSPDEFDKFSGIDFRDSENGIIVGTQGVIYYTENGGETWTPANLPAEDTLLKVQYITDTRAVAMGLRGCITQTDDGGKNWTAYCLPFHYTWLCGIAVTAGGNGYLVGDAGNIFVTKDRGQRWMPYAELGN
jgi:photosystem II stability/assembly factor-like uncharacterized protein